jgi:hypothetical protein
MIEDWMFKLDDDPKIRAQSLADAAESQRRPGAVDTPGMRDERNMWWRLGALRFWKSEAFKLRRAPHPFPTYFRGSLQMTLFPDMRFRSEPFTTKEGHAAIAILFCSEKNPKGTFATFALDEDEASRIINFMNAELDETRTLASERFRASGGDPRRRRLTAGPQPRRDVSPARRSPRRPRAVTQHVSHSTSTAR